MRDMNGRQTIFRNVGISMGLIALSLLLFSALIAFTESLSNSVISSLHIIGIAGMVCIIIIMRLLTSVFPDISWFRPATVLCTLLTIISLLLWSFSFYPYYFNQHYYPITRKPGGYFAQSSYPAPGEWCATTGQFRIIMNTLFYNRSLHISEPDCFANVHLTKELTSLFDDGSLPWFFPEKIIKESTSFNCNQEIYDYLTQDQELLYIYEADTKNPSITYMLYLDELGKTENVVAIYYEEHILFVDAQLYKNLCHSFC